MDRCKYENSPFCSSLSPEDRAAICPHCRPFAFKRHADAQASCKAVASTLEPNVPRCVVILEGLLCTNSSRNAEDPKVFLLWQPGDIMRAELVFDIVDDLSPLYHSNYMLDGAYALFPAQVFKDRFMTHPDFAAHLFKSVTKTRLRQTSFLFGTRLQDAKSALMYLLLFCEENGMPALTHQDFAYLTGLNRTTVTKTLKQILAGENLSISLKDYIRSMYEDG